MSGAGVRLGVGTRFLYDGEAAEVVGIVPRAGGDEVIARYARGGALRVSVWELLAAERVQVIVPDAGPAGDDPGDVASVVLAQLDDAQRDRVLERAAHVLEVLTGYRSGHAALALEGEPRAPYAPGVRLMRRYEAKAAELGIGERTLRQWVADYQREGEAGLAREELSAGTAGGGRTDERWVEMALEVMVEHTGESKPSRTMVIDRTNARVVARFGPDAVKPPGRTTAFRILETLEQRHPTFRLSTKRNRDIAERPAGTYGKLRPTRPGEYMLMDTTRLDVFGLDPVTLRWVQAELTLSMDWYTRCITGIRVTPVSTKAVDAAATLFQSFRPKAAGADWPAHAVWPQHGIPRSVLLDPQVIQGPMSGAAGPKLVPETIVIDHGKIYVAEHLTSVCRRMGISIQPVRLRTGRDKGPVERFFRTLREDLLQKLPGYKGPDLFSRGENPEGEAFFFLHELEAIIREWVACSYHLRPHQGLVEPHLPKLELSPAVMFEHGVARGGYVEVPRDPYLALEFLKTEMRTIQHYGIDYDRRRYSGAVLRDLAGQRSPYRDPSTSAPDKQVKWPIQVNPDDISCVYFRDPRDRRWHKLDWEHAPALRMPLSEEAMEFGRKLAAATYRYPDDKAAVALLLERWNLGLGMTLAERRMALRLSREQAALDLPDLQDEVAALPSVRRLAELPESAATPRPEPPAEAGDDDEDDFADGAPDAAPDDFYSEALGDA